MIRVTRELNAVSKKGNSVNGYREEPRSVANI